MASASGQVEWSYRSSGVLLPEYPPENAEDLEAYTERARRRQQERPADIVTAEGIIHAAVTSFRETMARLQDTLFDGGLRSDAIRIDIHRDLRDAEEATVEAIDGAFDGPGWTARPHHTFPGRMQARDADIRATVARVERSRQVVSELQDAPPDVLTSSFAARLNDMSRQLGELRDRLDDLEQAIDGDRTSVADEGFDHSVETHHTFTERIPNVFLDDSGDDNTALRPEDHLNDPDWIQDEDDAEDALEMEGYDYSHPLRQDFASAQAFKEAEHIQYQFEQEQIEEERRWGLGFDI